ncbi:multiple sugar transport system permease protein [Georgenia satyanarayanai]|uniref:Multiple sugar transport system permease protein n=1 Tax=Georgenia satyanarayanai TaxID=860221 RepID=A0A2Y9AIJ7_9MICO|nr:sugar ABC transporter permease [Georgenia satyanarayanai]PYF99296.1 multiple sugar transport system permease protein [Georgenia satyanarayanai]SSA43108.1 multiple sugar transport system permease protein [Georgenia satyanarayanai]
MSTTPSDVVPARAPGSPAAPARDPERPRRRRPTATTWAGLAFLAPLLAYLVVFYAYPLWRNIDLSTHWYDARAFVQGDAEFVGLDNHEAAISSSSFGLALRNTAVFTLGSIAAQYVIGLALAVFFHRSFPLSALLRGAFLIPWLLPLIVSGSVWSWMLNSEYGIINSVLGAFGIGQVNWLTDPGTALLSVLIANIWLGIPFNLVILYSGLQNIPTDMYEAASLDGASGWQQFRSITFPLLRPVTAITLLLGFVYTLKVVDLIWVMTTGGPGSASANLAVLSYRFAFGTAQPNFSMAAAIGNILILLALAVGLLYLYLQRRQEKS